jgi:hypothetical protein
VVVGDWLQKGMDEKSMIFMGIKEVHDQKQCDIKVWINIVHDYAILMHFKSVEEWQK